MLSGPPPAQVKHLLGEGFLSLRRQVGAKHAQACPHSFDTTLSGKPDSCPYLGAQMAVLTHAAVYLINHSSSRRRRPRYPRTPTRRYSRDRRLTPNSENLHQGACGGFRCLLIAGCDVAHRGANRFVA